MTSKQIYLIRHGQTDFNLKGIVQGSGVDSSINEHGMRQARAFFELYKDVPFKRVYTSSLKRTEQSVQAFIDGGLPHTRLAGLNEISWGTREGQRITPEEDVYYHWMLSQWQAGNTHLRIEGGESPDDVAARQAVSIRHIMGQTDEDIVLVCMHGRAMRILLCQLLNYPLHSMDQFEHENLCLYHLHYSGSMYQVAKYNDIRHLEWMKGPGITQEEVR